MHRILVLCERDWLNPSARSEGHYVYEVFRRIAAAGHYVAVLSAEPSIMAFLRPKGAATREVDGIHLARLGYGPLYRKMVGAFFARAARGGGLLDRFDVVVDCITRRPFPVADHVAIPVLPIVFGLDKRFRSDGDPPGPVVASSQKAYDALERAGLPAHFIVRAPFGSDSAGSPSGGGRAEATSWDDAAITILATADSTAEIGEGQ
ncbi:MAG: hypothetical protein GY851_36120 [bacterium]|nr:hypothetical protein [bacterium]